jgi:hypothetical protein
MARPQNSLVALNRFYRGLRQNHGRENTMSSNANDIEHLVGSLVATLALPSVPADAPLPQTGMRERFFEMMVLVLANLYGKTPLAAPLFSRDTMLRITSGMDDNDAGKLSARGEDWLRLEGILRQQDGQKAYFLTRPALSVLSSITSQGTLGEVIERALAKYGEGQPPPELRKALVLIGSYFLSRVVRS